jgi:hypothetical protein
MHWRDLADTGSSSGESAEFFPAELAARDFVAAQGSAAGARYLKEFLVLALKDKK